MSFGSKPTTPTPGNTTTGVTAPGPVVPVVDPAQLANRVNTERRRRLASGGSQSTFLSRTVGSTSGGPSPTLPAA